MTTQPQLEMLPKTQIDIAKIFLSHFEDEVEKTTKAMLNAQAKVAEALKLREMAKHEVARHAGKSVMQEAADIVNSGALDAEGMTVTASVSPAKEQTSEEFLAACDARAQKNAPAVDPITGEIEAVPVADWECPACRGDGRLPDKTGGGHHRCKACNGTGHAEPSCDNCTGYGDCNISQQLGSSTMGCGGKSWMHGEETTSEAPEPAVSVVVVLYPGSDEPVVTKIGEKTRYGELVADYFTAAGLNGKHDAKDWTVVAEDELTTTGGLRKLRDVITGADYGKRLLVVAAGQGSVTGVEEGSRDE